MYIMNKKNILLWGLCLCATMGIASCRDFDEVNTNPTAASQDQVLPEYLINRAIIVAQQNPHIAERAFVLYWRTGGHQHRRAGLSVGSFNDGWSSDYYSSMSTESLKPLYTAISIIEQRIKSGSARDYDKDLMQVARIWRAYMLSELCDNFGVVALDGYNGANPTYVGAKEAYAYILKELKEAAASLSKEKVALPKEVSALDRAYSYDVTKWRAYANSLRMRLAMRLSEVDEATAKANFEEAAAAGGILTEENRFAVQEKDGWDDLTGVMSRQWRTEWISTTYNNLVIGLGGVESKKQLTDARYASHIKPADYLGVRYDKHFPLKTTDPSAGFYMDGLPGVIDPRAYKTFIIAGDTENPDFCFYPSWSKAATTTEYKLKDATDQNKDFKTIETRYTWNAWVGGSWGDLNAINDLVQVGTMPRLGLKYRNSTNKRVFFGEWETYFLIAEAAVRGWTVPLTGKDAYEKGIRASFAYQGAGSVDSYLTSQTYNRVGTSVAWDHTTEPAATVTMKCTNGYTGQTENYTYRYPEMKSRLYKAAMNDHLTKIITQKFIANTPWLPLETWSDHRRLGLPFFETPAVEKALDNMPQLTASTYSTVSVDYYPQRLPLPSSIVNGNKPGYESAIKALGGEDKVFTPIYWAKKKQ